MTTKQEFIPKAKHEGLSRGMKGNTNAARNKPWTAAINRALIRFDGGKLGALNMIADQIVRAAVQGDQFAIKEIADRLDGKAAQSVLVSGEDGGPIVMAVEKLQHLSDEDLANWRRLAMKAGLSGAEDDGITDVEAIQSDLHDRA